MLDPNHISKIDEITDPFCTENQLKAGVAVGTAIKQGFEQMLRTISNMTSSSLSISMLFSFNPNPENKDPQSRLSIYIAACTKDTGEKEIVKLLIERSPITNFYRLIQIEKLDIPWKKLKAACRIVRREDAVTPLYTGEFNEKIPEYYYTIRPFEPGKNNWINLDRVLGSISERVIIKISITHADISRELAEHTKYLARLQSINKTWNPCEIDEEGFSDYFNKNPRGFDYKSNLKTLRFPDPLAEDLLRTQKRFHESLRFPHLQFDISILTETTAVASLIGSVVAESAFEGGSYRLLHHCNDLNFIEQIKNYSVSYIPIHKKIFPGRDSTLYSGLARLSHLATIEELSTIFCLPVSSVTSPQCIRKNTDPSSQNLRDMIVSGRDQEGSHGDRGPSIPSLCKHVFINGMSGVGKTTSTLNLCLQLKEKDIRFMVIEPAKTEYRILKALKKHGTEKTISLMDDLELYTPGNEEISPFRFNPLLIPPGISKNEHIENVLSCFYAVMPVSGPLPALLAESLERVYEKFPDKNHPPLIKDLVVAAEEVLAEKGYSPETNSDIKAALKTRIEMLTHLSTGCILQCRESTPQIEHLMNVSSIIEFGRVQKDYACFIILLLITNIREYLKTVPKTEKNPRFVIIIEEAHNIVGRCSVASASPDVADPKAFAAEIICRALVELRSFGVSIFIVDQHPSAIAPEVIKSTATKLAFRQVAREDREELAAAMLFSEIETEDIARLKTGEAFYFSEGSYSSRRIHTTDIYKKYDFSTDVLNEKIMPYIKENTWFKEATVKRLESELLQLLEEMDRFDKERLRLVSQLATLKRAEVNILKTPVTVNRNNQISDVISKATSLKKDFTTLLRQFIRDAYSRYLPPDGELPLENKSIDNVRNYIKDHFENEITPGIDRSITIIEHIIINCKTSLQEKNK